MPVRELGGDELEGWDAAAVDAPGGHVYQGRAWAAHRAASGWRPRFLAWGDVRALVLERPWPGVGGGSAYLPRGPVGGGRPWTGDGSGPGIGVALGAIANHLADGGTDVVAADPEVAASDDGYRRALDAAGFHGIAEIQPSRHRMALPLPPGTDPDAVMDGIAKTTRQRIRRAERDGVVVVRWDAAPGELEGTVRATEAAPDALRRFYGLLRATGDRRGFGFAGPDEFVGWWTRALGAGHLVYLEAREGATDGDVLGGLVLYRHGDRLSTQHSGDRAERRRDHPGAMHLLRWRAISLALAEGRTEMDLGGVDVADARREPVEGEPTYGLYEHKRSFGAAWVALVGAQERVAPALAIRAGAWDGEARTVCGAGERCRVTGPPTVPDPASVAGLVAAAQPTGARPLGGLVARLDAAGLLRGSRHDDLPIGAAGLSDVAIRGIVEDSRAVTPGSLFVAVPGFHVDGASFVAQAAAAGAGAAIVEQAVAGTDLPQVVVAAARPALAHAAGWWHGDPSRRLGVVGITGTDGKTTTSFLALAALEAAGISTGLVGTVETKVGDVRERHEAHVTTPGAPELQATLAAMVANGNAAAVLETTSHALALDRVTGVAYDAAIFTNLTHEHLDLHGTFEAYRAAKLRLFSGLALGPATPGKTIAGRPWPRVAILNRDDPAFPWFDAAARGAGATVRTYGLDAAADVVATAIEEDAHRLRIRYRDGSGEAALELRLAGRFNVHNALAVVALGEALGLDSAAVRRGLEGVQGVPGRMERIEAGQPFGVIVDYAHSPASLAGVLDLLAPVAAARGGGLIAVFGSGGERDTAKRGQMGRIAGERCRLVVATDEDPRGEDPAAIVDEVVRGAEAAGRRRDVDVLAIPDRRAAIAAALERARPGDIVLLAGKGHEPTILYADHALPWDEAAVALEILAALGFDGVTDARTVP